VKIDKELIFWPEIIAILGYAAFFLFSALVGLPQRSDELCRAVQNSQRFRDETSSGSTAGLAHTTLRLCKVVSTVMYLIMQLGSTVLVSPMMQTLASAMACVRPDDVPWTDALLGNPDDTIFLAAAPHVMCWKGPHLSIMFLIAIIVPFYLVVLIPYAVCAGDANYVPTSTLWDWQIWKEDNNWYKAAMRSATDLHLAFLHPNPRYVFRTNLLDLIAKVSLPIVTILLAPDPLIEMSLVTAIGAMLYFNAMFRAPYVERKMTVLVQDLKLFTMLTMACGVLTVYLADPDSSVPIYGLVGSGVITIVMLVAQLASLNIAKPTVKHLHVGQNLPATEQSGEDAAAEEPEVPEAAEE